MSVPRRSWAEPIRLGLGITIGFALIVGYLVFPKLNNVWDLKLNELGDFLAGISSTLAFIWIIIAVLLQRDELQAQRDELRQSREVYSLQAAELKRTADQQKIQVEIMQEQLKAATSERKVRESFEIANRRQQAQFRIQATSNQLTALAAYRERLLGIDEGIRIVSPGHRWPTARALVQLAELGQLQSLLGPIPDAPAGPAAQNFLQKLQSVGNAVRNHLHTVEQTQLQNAASRSSAAELDRLDREITSFSIEIRGILEQIGEAALNQNKLLAQVQNEIRFFGGGSPDQRGVE